MLSLDELNARLAGTLPGLLGIEIRHWSGTDITCELPIRPELLAPNGFLHAGTVVTLADSACGFGVMLNLPSQAQGFTTIELKSNFLSTAREGVLLCEAAMVHGGRTTQVWDARVIAPAKQQTIALFRCTQLILYPR